MVSRCMPVSSEAVDTLTLELICLPVGRFFAGLPGDSIGALIYNAHEGRFNPVAAVFVTSVRCVPTPV